MRLPLSQKNELHALAFWLYTFTYVFWEIKRLTHSYYSPPSHKYLIFEMNMKIFINIIPIKDDVINGENVYLWFLLL